MTVLRWTCNWRRQISALIFSLMISVIAVNSPCPFAPVPFYPVVWTAIRLSIVAIWVSVHRHAFPVSHICVSILILSPWSSSPLLVRSVIIPSCVSATLTVSRPLSMSGYIPSTVFFLILCFGFAVPRLIFQSSWHSVTWLIAVSLSISFIYQYPWIFFTCVITVLGKFVFICFVVTMLYYLFISNITPHHDCTFWIVWCRWCFMFLLPFLFMFYFLVFLLWNIISMAITNVTKPHHIIATEIGS